MTGILWSHWAVCVVMAVFYAFVGDAAAESSFVAASIIILAIGEKK